MLAIKRIQFEVKNKQVWKAINNNGVNEEFTIPREDRAYLLGEVFRHAGEMLKLWKSIPDNQPKRIAFEEIYRKKLKSCADMGLRAVNIWWTWNDPVPEINPNGSYFSMFIHPNKTVRKSLEKRRLMILRVFYRYKIPFDVSNKIIIDHLY